VSLPFHTWRRQVIFHHTEGIVSVSRGVKGMKGGISREEVFLSFLPYFSENGTFGKRFESYEDQDGVFVVGLWRRSHSLGEWAYLD
jgi:hypothetical protein